MQKTLIDSSLTFATKNGGGLAYSLSIIQLKYFPNIFQQKKTTTENQPPPQYLMHTEAN